MAQTLYYAAIALAALGICSGCSTASAKSGNANSRQDISLTVYKEDFGVISETRPVLLSSGRNTVHLLDLSKQLNQESLIFDWTKGNQANVVSTTYDLGVSESTHLLKRYLGKSVELVRYGQDGRESERVRGILEVADPGNLVLNVDGKYLVNPPGSIEASDDNGVVAIPQLRAEVDSASAQNAGLKISYLTGGFSWGADYVGTMKNDGTMALEVWATVTNKTGIDYPNAKVTLVAGEPNRALIPYDGSLAEAEGGIRHRDLQIAGSIPAKQRLSPEATGELYEYPVDARVSIAPDQSSRVKMSEVGAVPVKKDYSVRLPDFDYEEYDNAQTRHNAVLAISFKNEKSQGLGLPLPAGAFRIYEPDSSGTQRYIGAATLPDTPKDSGAFLSLSNVFDVYAQSRVNSTKIIDKHRVRKDLEVRIHNSKESAVAVRIVQNVYGKWQVAAESDESTKPDATTLQWVVNVPAGTEKVITSSLVFVR